MYSKSIRLDLNKFRQGEKNLKLQLCRQHFLVESLLVIKPPNIVPPSENAVGTAVILDFLFFSVRLTSQDHKCQRSETFRKGVWLLINVHLVARFLNFDLENLLTGLLAFFYPIEKYKP